MFVFFIFIVLSFLVFVRFVYFRPVSCVYLAPGASAEVVSVKPTFKWFRSVSAGKRNGFVKCSSGYILYFVHGISTKPLLSFGDFVFTSPVYVFRLNFFGRLVSSDLSDRNLFDLVKKFDSIN